MKNKEQSTNPNNYSAQKIRGIKRKLELIKRRGGKCEICGYDKNLSALEFHHKNPEDKEFPLDAKHLSNRTMEKINKEFDKCILLCANCHAEIHNPDLDLVNINKKLKQGKEILKRSQERKKRSRKQSKCLNCGRSFDMVDGKLFCCSDCRKEYSDKINNHPTLEQLNIKHEELHSWAKTYRFFNISEKVGRRIRGILKQQKKNKK